MEILDLTKPLDGDLELYASGSYSDPPLQVETWCTVQEQGYWVSRLAMGTQTGTHIDAPAHMVAGGATLDALPLQALIGPYLWVDLGHITLAELSALRAGQNRETILFLASAGPTQVTISQQVLSALLDLPCLVWVIVTGVAVAGHKALHFHRALAEAGKYLVEDVEPTVAGRVKAGGEMIALPLRLKGVSGSPCRVVVRQSKLTGL